MISVLETVVAKSMHRKARKLALTRAVRMRCRVWVWIVGACDMAMRVIRRSWLASPINSRRW